MTTDQNSTPKPSYRGWYLALTIVIAAILLVLAIWGVSWQEMLDTLRKVDLKYLAFIFILGSLSVFVRGLRWGVLLSAEKQIKAIDDVVLSFGIKKWILQFSLISLTTGAGVIGTIISGWLTAFLYL
jgi:hypothetical protein